MGIAESGLMVIAGVLMVIALFASLLPFLPGPFMLWVISLVYGILTGFQHLTVLSAIVITLLMIIATTKDIWMPIVGMKTYGVSCSSAIGMFVGGIIGTFAVPIPILGTLIGAIAGAILLELLNLGDLQKALKAGGFAFKSFLLGMATEFGFNILIVAVFFGSLLVTRS
ncbi:MAG: DUF456 family protein [Chloroflexi bacterium]|nr:DUF456 family protein [Chloroflexota bacterium]